VVGGDVHCCDGDGSETCGGRYDEHNGGDVRCCAVEIAVAAVVAIIVAVTVTATMFGSDVRCCDYDGSGTCGFSGEECSCYLCSRNCGGIGGTRSGGTDIRCWDSDRSKNLWYGGR